MPPMAVQVHVLRSEPLDVCGVPLGSLFPNEEVQLVSELAGRITADRGFEEGGQVSAGQVLLRIHDDELQATQLRKAEADLRLARGRRGPQVAALAAGRERHQPGARSMRRLRRRGRAAGRCRRPSRAHRPESVIRAPFRRASVGLRSVSEGGFVASEHAHRPAAPDRSNREGGVRRARALWPHPGVPQQAHHLHPRGRHGHPTAAPCTRWTPAWTPPPAR